MFFVVSVSLRVTQTDPSCGAAVAALRRGDSCLDVVGGRCTAHGEQLYNTPPDVANARARSQVGALANGLEIGHCAKARGLGRPSSREVVPSSCFRPFHVSFYLSSTLRCIASYI